MHPSRSEIRGDPGDANRLTDKAAGAPLKNGGAGATSLSQELDMVLGQDLPAAELCGKIVKTVADDTGVTAAALLGYEPRRQRIRFLSSVGLEDDAKEIFNGHPERVSWDIPLRCLRSHRINVVTNAQENPFVPEPLRKLGSPALSIAVIPFYQANMPAGTVVLFLAGRSEFHDQTLRTVGETMRTCSAAISSVCGTAPRRLSSPAAARSPSQGGRVRLRLTAPTRALLRSKQRAGSRGLQVGVSAAAANDARVGRIKGRNAARQAERGRLQELEKELRDLGKVADGVREENLRLQKALARAEERAEAAADTNAALASTRDELHQRLEQTREMLRAQKDRATALEQQLRELSSQAAQMADVEASIAEVDAARAEAGREVKQLQEEIETADSARTQAEREGHAARAEAELLRVQLGEFRERVANLETEQEKWGDVDEHLELVKAERTWLQQALADTRGKLSVAECEREKWPVRLAEIESERDLLRDELEQVREMQEAPRPQEESSPTREPEALAGLDPAFGRELLDAFAGEAGDLIEGSESMLLELEQRPDDKDLLQALFRNFHTLKGSAAAVGIETAAAQLHHAESFLEALRDGEVSVDGHRLVDFLLRLTDSIAGLIYKAIGIHNQPYAIMRDVDQEIGLLRAGTAGSKASNLAGEGEVRAPGPAASAKTGESESGAIRIQAENLDALFRETERLFVSRRRMQYELRAAVKLSHRLAKWCARLAGTEAEEGEHGAEPDRQATLQPRTRKIAQEASAIAEQFGMRLNALSEQGTQFSKITEELERQIGRLRTCSFGNVFRRLRRPARDMARRAGKVVTLSFEGGDLRLDREVVEALHGPLLHLLRNAVSHGIEAPKIREANGKRRSGKIRVEAEEDHGQVVITVADDGSGVDLEAVLAKARARGLVDPDQTPPREELLNLVFQPGFSTMDTVTELSGRGVGMDVVAEQVSALNGTVEIVSTDGEGTLVRLTVPNRIVRTTGSDGSEPEPGTDPEPPVSPAR